MGVPAPERHGGNEIMSERPHDATHSSKESPSLLRLSTRIVAAYLAGNETPAQTIPGLIATVHGTLAALACAPATETSSDRPVSAVSVRRSVTPDYIVCLEDGRRLKMLKRYLRAAYGMTPDEYRTRWNLPANYPMVAPNYARHRSEFAKKIGLGKRAGS